MMSIEEFLKKYPIYKSKSIKELHKILTSLMKRMQDMDDFYSDLHDYIYLLEEGKKEKENE